MFRSDVNDGHHTTETRPGRCAAPACASSPATGSPSSFPLRPRPRTDRLPLQVSARAGLGHAATAGQRPEQICAPIGNQSTTNSRTARDVTAPWHGGPPPRPATASHRPSAGRRACAAAATRRISGPSHHSLHRAIRNHPSTRADHAAVVELGGLGPGGDGALGWACYGGRQGERPQPGCHRLHAARRSRRRQSDWVVLLREAWHGW
jgi:hypothetical protein